MSEIKSTRKDTYNR
jgi:hypothetical protein